MRMKLSKKNYIKLHYVYKAKKGSGSSLQNLKRKNMYHPRKLLEYPGSSRQNLGDPEQDTKGSPL